MSDKLKSTPGPWHWVYTGDDRVDQPVDYSEPDERLIPEAQLTHFSDVSLRTVAEHSSHGVPVPDFLCESHEISRADAALIAAAPELLAALKQWQRTWEESDCEYDDCQSAFETARAALKVMSGNQETK